MGDSEVMSEEWIRDYLLSLREGDTILVNDRDQPWTLVQRYWDDHESGYWRYRFAGSNTHYEGIVPPDDSVNSFTSDGGKDVLITSIRTPCGKKPKLISDTSVDEWIDEPDIDMNDA
jgi:hypothetical protein